MLPVNLEIVMYLKENIDLWNVQMVQDFMSKFPEGTFVYAEAI